MLIDENNDYTLLVDSFQQVMFFEPSLQHPYANGIHGNVVFTNNTAGTAGNELFGGWGDICISHKPSLNLYEVGEDYFNSAFHFSPDPNDLSSVVSKASRVCICTETTLLPNCMQHHPVQHNILSRKHSTHLCGDHGTKIWGCSRHCDNYTVSKRGSFPHSPTVPDNFEPLHRSGLHCILTRPC